MAAAHHVHSKLMAWVALDRALKIADTQRVRPAQRARLDSRTCSARRRRPRPGYNEQLGAYTGVYDSDELDAAVLLPVLDFERAGSPRVTGTINAIRQRLSAGGPLLSRYDHGRDGLDGREGAFLACSFWLVHALARTGRTDEATSLFEELLALASPLGLYAEDIDPTTRQHLGNFPQALTHAALVQAATSFRSA